jgi:hypothetical protein
LPFEFFATAVETDVVSHWSDERSQDIHELYVRLAAVPDEPGIGLSVWRELDAAGPPGAFAGEPVVAFADREPEGSIAQVHLTRGQLRLVLPGGAELVARFDLEDEEFEPIRGALREMFAGHPGYAEQLASGSRAAHSE